METYARVIAFTGNSSVGFTDAQRDKFILLVAARTKGKPFEFHHGDCVKADEQAHAIIKKEFAGLATVHIWPGKSARPGKLEGMRANCFGEGDVMYPEMTFFARNRAMVDISDLLIGIPVADKELYHGGTWYTINYARKVKRDTLIVFPGGVVKWEPGGPNEWSTDNV